MFFTLNKTFLIYFAPRSSNQATTAWNKKTPCFSKLSKDNIKSLNLRAVRLRNLNTSLRSFHLFWHQMLVKISLFINNILIFSSDTWSVLKNEALRVSFRKSELKQLTISLLFFLSSTVSYWNEGKMRDKWRTLTHNDRMPGSCFGSGTLASILALRIIFKQKDIGETDSSIKSIDQSPVFVIRGAQPRPNTPT